MLHTSEKAFETVIEQVLLSPPGLAETRADYQAGLGYRSGGYLKRTSADYDPEQCLIPADLFDFIQASQPKMWAKFLKIHAGNVVEAKQQFRHKLAADLKKRGMLSLLRDRQGFRLEGCRFDLIYFKPASSLNPATQQFYQANRFAVLRQFHYKPASPGQPLTGPSLDLGLFVNGLPIFTVELKNQLTGQTIADAQRQYQNRDFEEPLFAFGRCLAHFAVDNNEVFFATHLRGPDTEFYPFNQGYANGAGNPPSATGFATAYLWEQLWAKDSILNLLQQFIYIIELEDDKGHKTGQKQLLFPRFHQLDAVRRLIHDAAEQGAGQRYLVQHSAGSGKSNSIAWLAHQLASLHDRQNEKVFHSVIVITDRRVLDRQLQRTMRQFQQVEGVVENIDQTSRQLQDALEDGKQIIVTTLQKFPVIVNRMGDLPGQRFAVIIDEAHSSQSGESTKSVHAVLTVNNLDEETDEDEAPGSDLEDLLIEQATQRKLPPNVSFFAFTATPKPKTMELFGQRQPDGAFIPFSLYSMRQAIQEGFILDVLENFTTYKTYWNLLKTIADDPHYDRQQAARLLKAFVETHDLVLAKKVEIIVEHLAGQVSPQIGGQAKAMLVTSSRRQAVRYKLAVDRYLKEKGYPFKALVAFSGTLKVEDGGDIYSEAGMNGFPEKQTAEVFKRPAYRLLIVANKFQTGFDQPLLHTMYVDKKLNGVNAVQTLSRLNRTHPGKSGTAIIDFTNDTDAIQKAFQPYYDRTILSEKTDPNLLYDLESRLDNHFFYSGEELDRFARLYLTATDADAALPQLHALLDPVVARYKAAAETEQAGFRQALTDYIRLYAFLAQTARFEDADLEKLYLFGKFLVRKLPGPKAELPLAIQQQIALESLRVAKTGSGKIELERGQGTLAPVKPVEGPPLSPLAEQEILSTIIKELNAHYGFEASTDEVVTVQHLETKLDASDVLKVSAQVNSKDNFKLSFESVVKEKFQELLEDNFKLYKKITDDPDFAQNLMDALLDRYLQRLEGNGEAFNL